MEDNKLLNKSSLEEELIFNDETGEWETILVDKRTLSEFKKQQQEIDLNLQKNDIFVYKDNTESKRVLKDTLNTKLDDVPIGIEHLNDHDRKLYELFLERKKITQQTRKNNRGKAPLIISEKQIRYSMENTNSISEAADFIKVSRHTWAKYAKMYFDINENKSLYEIFMLKCWGVPSGKALVFKSEYKARIKEKQQNSLPHRMIDPETNRYISRYENKALTKRQKITLHNVLQGLHPDYNPVKLKRSLLKLGWMESKCECCGFTKSRDDGKTPLILNFKDGNKRNHKRDNLEMLCFNCFFINSELYDNRYYYKF